MRYIAQNISRINLESADLFARDTLSLRRLETDKSVSADLNSQNFGTVANRPLLTIVAVPEPGTPALGGLGLALLGIRRWVGRRE